MNAQRFSFCITLIVLLAGCLVFLTCVKKLDQHQTDENISEDLIYEYLLSHETSDTILKMASKKVRETTSVILKRINAPIDNVDLFVTSFDDKLPLQAHPYFTNNCIAVLKGLRRPSIICNAQFLYEAETVIRSYEKDFRILLSDANMFGFIRGQRKPI